MWLYKINVDIVLIFEIMKKIGFFFDIIKVRKYVNIKFEMGFECGIELLGKDEDIFIFFEEVNGSCVI